MFPLALDKFSDRLRVTGLSLYCDSPKAVSRTAGGEILQARLGASLWKGECHLQFSRHTKTGGMRALADMLLDENASFLISPRDYYGPAADPDAAILGSAPVTLTAVAGDNRTVTLSGFPAGYVLSPDDLLSFSYGTGPVRYAFHRITFQPGRVVKGEIRCEVWPRIRPGWEPGIPVSLRRPFFKAVMTERDPGSGGGIFHSGMSFSFIQSLR